MNAFYCCVCGAKVPPDSKHFTGGMEGEYLCDEHNTEEWWEDYCNEKTPRYDSLTGEEQD